MRSRAIALTLVFIAGPALAWDLNKSEDSVTAGKTVGNYRAKFTCYRGRDYLEFGLLDLTLRGEGMEPRTPMMIWITAPDGRTDKWSFVADTEGPSLIGTISVSSFTLDNFGNGATIQIENQATHTNFIETDMKGTGAARIAFRERCGM